MKYLKSKPSQYVIATIVFLSVVAFIGLLYPFMWAIVAALLTAYFFLPLHKRYQKRFPKMSLVLSWVSIIWFVLVPASIVLYFLVSETSGIVQEFTSSTFLEDAIAWFNIQVASLPFADLQVDSWTIKEELISRIQTLASSISSFTVSLGSSVIWLITGFIVYFFVVTALLTKWHVLVKQIKEIVPLENRIIDLYLKRLWLMSSSIVKSTFIIAIVQGVLTALSFSIAGVPYFTFFAFVATLLSVIPMIGASFLAIPTGIILMLTGSLWRGIGVILFNQIVINNIDNLMRPKLVHKWAKIHDTLFLLGVFGGMQRRWMAGILYGPVLMSFILTTFEVAKTERNKLLRQSKKQEKET